MAWNPHVKFYNDNRVYVNAKITKDAMTADFRTLDAKASFEIRDGVPGLQ